MYSRWVKFNPPYQGGKKVDLCGDAIMAAQDKDGQVWAGVRWLCDGLGLSEGQTKNERKRLQDDIVLSLPFA